MTVIISFPKDVDRVNRQHERNKMTKEKTRCESVIEMRLYCQDFLGCMTKTTSMTLIGSCDPLTRLFNRFADISSVKSPKQCALLLPWAVGRLYGIVNHDSPIWQFVDYAKVHSFPLAGAAPNLNPTATSCHLNHSRRVEETEDKKSAAPYHLFAFINLPKPIKPTHTRKVAQLYTQAYLPSWNVPIPRSPQTARRKI